MKSSPSGDEKPVCATDVYVKNLATGKLTLASAKSNGDQFTALGGANNALGASERPLAISADGRFVAFETIAKVTGKDSGATSTSSSEARCTRRPARGNWSAGARRLLQTAA